MYGQFMHRPLEEEKPKEPLPKTPKGWILLIGKLIKTFAYRMSYIVMLVWSTRPWIIVAMMVNAIINGITPVINAYIGKEIFDKFGQAIKGELDSFWAVGSMVFLLLAFQFITGVIQSVYGIINRIASDLVTNNIQLKIMNKAKEIDLASYDSPEFYSKLENANREAGTRPMNMLSQTFSIFSTIISMSTFIVILFAFSPIAPLIVVIAAIPTTIINYTYRRKTFNFVFRRSRDRREMNYYSNVLVNKDLVKEIKIFNLADTFINRFKEVFTKYFSGMRKLIVSEGAWNIGLSVFRTAATGFLFLWIAYRVYKGEFTIGDYSLYTGALGSISGGIYSLITTTAGIYEGTLFIDNMIVFMKEETTIRPIAEPALTVQREKGHTLEFVNVSFQYPGMENFVLKDINLKINHGETIAFVGLNGSGKTTLLKLMTRLYDPTEGVILLDGRDIREYDVKDLYGIFGIIFQDFGKYAFTVGENIGFGEIDKIPTLETLEDAARRSNAEEFIGKLELGYDTPLQRIFDLKGIELSGGQWQKIAISRAFFSDSDIMILDEPTAALDALAEQEIFMQFDALRENKTTIFVSHRLSSATIATKIIVLQNGEIIEEGHHSELIRLENGHYAEMFKTQAKRYLEHPEDEQTEQSGEELPMRGRRGRPMGVGGPPPGRVGGRPQ